MNCLRCGSVLRLQPQLSGAEDILSSQLHVEHTIEVASLPHRRHRKLHAGLSSLAVASRRLTISIQSDGLVGQTQVIPAGQSLSLC